MQSLPIIENYLSGSINAIKSINEQADMIFELAQAASEVLIKGGCIYWAGNGGSAADAQHLAAELVGRFEIDRIPLKSIAITTDTSTLTAIGNDFGFKQIFSRQIRALVNRNDLIIFISTSGKSENILEGLKTAKSIGCKTAVFTGKSRIKCDYLINIDADRTCHIQEGHITVGQLFCMLVETEMEKNCDDNNK